MERSIALAYEAVNHFPDRKVHITNELIHNPEVNDKLESMKVNFIEKNPDGKKRFESVQEGDVVIFPAFGASFEEMEYFDSKVGTESSHWKQTFIHISANNLKFTHTHPGPVPVVLRCHVAPLFLSFWVGRTWILLTQPVLGCPRYGTPLIGIRDPV